ncbi:DUF1616 domain-containing protein [Halobacteria archaeon AArc-curdl1]|uniref:DUF1616 domain-containing protein n=1 Tax=Natronosalvus hydrolyticus TaxID=2979988 RepID=A0AAP2ZAM3_9EURY|nr:DUF1616 domain-containing protein [Halobacteria archaeon AArc-curdl1]
MSDTNWWFFDQAVVIAATGLLTFGIFSGITGVIRIGLAIPLVLFLPGYALVSALFPDKPNDPYHPFDEHKTGLGNPLLVSGGLQPIERFILSSVFSVFLVPVIALIPAATPGGLTLETVLSGISIVTVVFAVIAIISRYRCQPERRYVPSFSFAPLFFRSRPTLFNASSYRPYNIAIVLSLFLVVASVGFAVTNPPQPDGYTEFSIETDDVTGDLETMYESAYTSGETETLNTSITNHEHDQQTYTTVLLIQQVSYEDGDVTVHETDELDRQTTTVADGETQQQTLEVTPTMQDDDIRLTVLLYDGDPPDDPAVDNAYRVITLPIEVS